MIGAMTISITAESGQVTIRHSQPVATEWLTPVLARQMAQALLEYADAAEQQREPLANGCRHVVCANGSFWNTRG